MNFIGKVLAFTFLHASQADSPSASFASSAAFKTALDSQAAQLQTALNSLIDQLNTNLATQAPIDYYVAPTGSDSAAGTIGAPFLTIQHAVDALPQTDNHAVTINMAAGTYAEDVTVSGFNGRGSITFNGTGTATDVTIRSIDVINCGLTVRINAMTFSSITDFAIFIQSCVYVLLFGVRVTAVSAGFQGVYCQSSNVEIQSCTFSNRLYGIYAIKMSDVVSSSTGGTGNTTGLHASGSVIMKNGTQPAGTTAESTLNGGVIR